MKLSFFFLLLSVPAFAAGGTCPSASTYSIQGATGTLTTLGVTNGCYFISKSTGSDTNAGTTEASPWAHMPGMPSCANNCSSATITGGGYGFILRGGEVWTASDLGVLWTHSGTSGAPYYIGVDLTWFNSSNCGGSWCRPVMNPNGSAMNTGTYYFFTNNGSTAVWTTIDNIEEKGWSCTAMESGTMNTTISPDSEYENMYAHGWSYTQPDTTCQVFAFGANTSSGASQVVNSYFHNNVVDGSDQAPAPNNSTSNCGTTAGCIPVGCVLHADKFINNVCTYIYNINGEFTQIYGNWVDHVLVGNSGDHCNMMNFAGILTGSIGYAFNNVFTNMECSGGLLLWLSGNSGCSTCTYYGFNNLFFSVNSGSAQRITTCTHPASGNCGTFYVFNNTDSASGGQLTGNGEASPRGTVNMANNFIIGTDTLCQNTGVTCNDDGNELTLCAGSGSGCANQNVTPHFNQYTDSQTPYADAPVASTNSTVAAGQNAATTFSITCSGVLAAACNDTTYATESATGHTVVMRTTNPRGSSWDIGAFQFVPASGNPGGPAPWFFALLK